MVQFAEFTEDEARSLRDILDRALDKYPHLDRLSLEMDISAVHAKTPLRLADLANATEFNFVHDIFGIIRHMNRKTGELEGCFLPRYTKLDGAA